MVHGPGEIAVLSGAGDPAREIYTDGRTMPDNPEPSWMGTSSGEWAGDTRSEAMRITERFRRRDFGHMDLEMSFDDPKYYTRPFGFKTTMTLLPDDLRDYLPK